MLRSKRLLLILSAGFLGTSYVALSSGTSDLLRPYLQKRERSITVGGVMQVKHDVLKEFTVEDIARLAKTVELPVEPPPTLAPSSGAFLAATVQPDPLRAFISQFGDFNSLAEGVLAQNAREKMWDPDKLFHAIEDSGRCSRSTLSRLKSTYCNHR